MGLDQQTDAAGQLLALGVEFQASLRILELEAQGGPTAEDYERVRGHAELIASGSDVLFRGGGKRSDRTAVLNALADAISVAAFVPGGIRVFGTRYRAGSANRVEAAPVSDLPAA